jgi:hypothetical protein
MLILCLDLDLYLSHWLPTLELKVDLLLLAKSLL